MSTNPFDKADREVGAWTKTTPTGMTYGDGAIALRINAITRTNESSAFAITDMNGTTIRTKSGLVHRF